MPCQTYDPEGTVETIVDNGLCTECGFCEPVCPTRAIRLEEDPRSGEILPRVDPELCVMCPLCLAVCPGETVDFDRYFEEYIGTTEYAKYTGYIERTYLGWSTDDRRRHGAASGGVLFELARFALESGRLDYLIFAKPRSDNPFRSETILTNRPEDLEGASGSIYYPVPLGENIDRLLHENVPRSAKLGLIGLPCHVHAAHKTFDTGRFRKYRWELLFGVFCGGTWSYKAIDQYLETKQLKRDDVSRFAFRGGGWPGKISLTTKDGRTIEEERHKPAITDRINKGSIFSANSFYTPHRCLTCSDGLADLADISFGDPWLKSQKGERDGKTLIVTRNEKALRLLMAAEAAGVVKLARLDNELAVVSQKSMLTFKQNYRVFSRIIGLITGRRTPRYEYKWLKNDRTPRALYAYALASYLCHLVARRTDSKYLRIPLATIRGLIARFTKDYLVRLTPRDRENYFS
jgi:coenzyme F420 hydrogenase subunit beta